MAFLFFLMVASVIVVNSSDVRILDIRTCDTLENSQTYEIYHLECSFNGAGLYVYKGPNSVKSVSLNRLTKDSFLNIPTTSSVTRVEILKGYQETCELVKARGNVQIFVNGRLCPHHLSSSTTTQHSGMTSLGNTPSQQETTGQGVDPTEGPQKTIDDSSTVDQLESTVRSSTPSPQETTVVDDTQSSPRPLAAESDDTNSIPWIVTTACCIAEYTEVLVVSLISTICLVVQAVNFLNRTFNNPQPALPHLPPVAIPEIPQPQTPAAPEPQVNLEQPPEELEPIINRPLRRSLRTVKCVDRFQATFGK